MWPPICHTHTTGSGRCARQNSTTIVLRLRTVYMYLPQPVLLAQPARGHEVSHPVVSCLSCGCALPALFMLGGSLSPRSRFRAPLWSGTWRGSASGRLMAVCAHLRKSPQLLLHTQTPGLRAVRVPLAGTRKGTALPKQPATADALLQAGWRPDLVLQMPRERDQPALAELPVSLRQPQDIRAPSASPLLADDDPSGSIKHYFLAGLWVASQAHLRHLVSPSRLAFCSRHSLIFGPWCVCPTDLHALLLQILLQILALGRRLRLPPLPSCRCVQTCGASWAGGPLRPLAPMAPCLHCRQG